MERLPWLVLCWCICIKYQHGLGVWCVASHHSNRMKENETVHIQYTLITLSQTIPAQQSPSQANLDLFPWLRFYSRSGNLFGLPGDFSHARKPITPKESEHATRKGKKEAPNTNISRTTPKQREGGLISSSTYCPFHLHIHPLVALGAGWALCEVQKVGYQLSLQHYSFHGL